MNRGVFVTGTDTGVGKTLVAAALIHAWVRRGLRVAGMKPVASGAWDQGEGLRNDDALQLQATANVTADYSEINPYVFEPAIAPHLAAAKAGQSIVLETILTRYTALAARADRVVVEGVGGWLVPLAGDLTTVDLAQALAIKRSGLQRAGWVANEASPCVDCVQDNIVTLQQRISAPLLGRIGHLQDTHPSDVAALLDTGALAQDFAPIP